MKELVYADTAGEYFRFPYTLLTCMHAWSLLVVVFRVSVALVGSSDEIPAIRFYPVYRTRDLVNATA